MPAVQQDEQEKLEGHRYERWRHHQHPHGYHNGGHHQINDQERKIDLKSIKNAVFSSLSMNAGSSAISGTSS